MKAIERLYEYLKNKGIRPTNFEREIGLSSGYLSVQRKRKADMGESILTKVSDNCQDLSMEWLLTGEGSMLKTQPANSAGHVVIGDFKGATSHFGDISISNGAERDALNTKEGVNIDGSKAEMNQILAAEIERLKAQVDLLMAQNKEQTSQIGVLLNRLSVNSEK
jgi:hypothetical protein